MGCAASTTRAGGGELTVSARVAPHFGHGKPTSDNGSDGTSLSTSLSAKPESLPKTSGGLPPTSTPEVAAPVMLYDTRQFSVEQDREAAVKALELVDTPVDDPRFNVITKLMSSIFQTPVALITLVTEDRVWFKSKVGPFGACVVREGSWCNYISVPNTPEVLITEDASEDARFAANPYVTGAPYIKFYAGAPLVGKNGMRYGTLCVVDLKRRSFSAEMYALLINFANLVVQELERDSAMMREVHDEVTATAEGQERIQKMLKTTTSSVALVDVRSRSWPLLYANDAFAQDQGSNSVDACTASGFWDLFGVAQGAEMHDLIEAVAAGRATRTTVFSQRTGQRLSVLLRPASSDQLQPSKAIGIPNWVPSERATDVGCHAGALPGALNAGGDVFEGPATTVDDAPTPQLASCFWFVTVEDPLGQAAAMMAVDAPSPVEVPSPVDGGSPPPSPAGAPRTPTPLHRETVMRNESPKSAAQLHTFSSKLMPSVLEGLEMGPMVGSGSFGRVYRGLWAGRVVAVKLIDCIAEAKNGMPSEAEVVLHEAELSKGLDHPFIVKTLEYALVTGEGGSATATLWIVQQMCNHGTLIEAVDRGWMRNRRSLLAPPCMRSVLLTLREVASAMAFLHANDILHCDLTGNNVLLDATERSEGDERGFTARVGDFGLARKAVNQVITATFGTCSHMAPELMTDGVLTKSADVWSFGVICWEMYNGMRAYMGLRMPHIVFLVTSGRATLTLPDSAPQGFKALMDSCLQRDHEKRPSFEQLVSRIDEIMAAGEEATVAPAPPPMHTGPCKASAEMAAAAVGLVVAA